MRVLVTGSSGLIGSLPGGEIRRHHGVVGYDLMEPASLPEGVQFCRGDMLNRNALARAFKGIEAVIHLAVIPYDIPPSHEVFHTNIQGTYNALELTVEAGASGFLFASGIMAYGFGQNVDPQYFSVDEEHPLLANRPYGLSKVVGEQLCRSFSACCGIRTYRFRLTTAVGPSVRCENYPCPARSMEVGIYQYVDVRDVAILSLSALKDQQITHGSFLVSAADSGHQLATAQVISSYYPEAEMRYGSPAVDTPFVAMGKARRLPGFQPRYSWRSERSMDIE